MRDSVPGKRDGAACGQSAGMAGASLSSFAASRGRGRCASTPLLSDSPPPSPLGCVTFFFARSRYPLCRRACRRRPRALCWYLRPASRCDCRRLASLHSLPQYRFPRSHHRQITTSLRHRPHRYCRPQSLATRSARAPLDTSARDADTRGRIGSLSVEGTSRGSGSAQPVRAPTSSPW
jgi:hypothetical protein